MNQEKIGKFIALKRKEKNLTQEELADKLGISNRAVSKWERGLNLPDASLMLELSNILGITVNELLSGEKIKKEDEENKFLENLVNTIDYSEKKVKNTKQKYKIILLIVTLIISFLVIAFVIDINQMKNRKPVIFSTWGFKYAPVINLNSLEMEKEIKNYLIAEDSENKKHETEKSFVSIRTYLITENKNNYYVYAWVLLEKYYLENDEVKKDTSISIPHKFFLTKENDKFVVLDYEIPIDGSYYERDLKNLFPNSVLKEIDNFYNDSTYERLKSEIDNQVELYFHK